VIGPWCAQCGQETSLALPSAVQFVREAAGRLIALDGRFWRTLHALMLRPGRLTREYLAGRRRRYVRPARLFLLTSVVLFAAIRLDSAPNITVLDGKVKPSAVEKADKGDAGKGIQLHIGALDADLPAPLRSRVDAFNRQPTPEKVDQLFSGATRYGPYAMAALLPAHALLMMFAYWGGKRRPAARPSKYAAHLVFAAHLHAFLFLAATLALVLPWSPVRMAILLWALAYPLLATRAVYGGGIAGTIFRAATIGIAYFALVALASVGLVFAAILLR
jgi:hypothetical protein